MMRHAHLDFWLWTFVIGLVLSATWNRVGLAQPKERMAHWVATYGEVSPTADARVQRAHEIFQRLLYAAGKRPGVVPRLLITARDPLDIALPIAIPDGSIILSKKVLERCYRDTRWGDDRLAFILGHELAHQLKDDFWHMQFFQALELSQAQLLDSDALNQLQPCGRFPPYANLFLTMIIDVRAIG